jgi:hypothetical protein
MYGESRVETGCRGFVGNKTRFLQNKYDSGGLDVDVIVRVAGFIED